MMRIVNAAASRLASPHRMYDLIQYAVGFRRTREVVRPFLAGTGHKTVLDIGGGTGLWGTALPAEARYQCLDMDPEKLKGFKKRFPNAEAILGDATRLDLPDGSIDCAMCMFVLHHLDDGQLRQVFGELARVVKEGIVILDPLRRNRWKSRLLWSLDRGSHPRDDSELLAAMGEYFEVTQWKRFTIQHEYLLAAARPKGRL